MPKQLWNDPAIYRIQVTLPQNPLKNLNSYVIKSKEQSLVIDTDFTRPECRQARLPWPTNGIYNSTCKN